MENVICLYVQKSVKYIRGQIKSEIVQYEKSCPNDDYKQTYLTHWGRVTHICVSNLTIIGSDNGLSPGRRQAIIWTNAGILFIGPLGTNIGEIFIKILTFSFKKIRLKVSSGKWRPFCLGLNVLNSVLRMPFHLGRNWTATLFQYGNGFLAYWVSHWKDQMVVLETTFFLKLLSVFHVLFVTINVQMRFGCEMHQCIAKFTTT